MSLLGDSVREYTAQLREGKIQQAYRGIMAFLSGLKSVLERKYPDYSTGAVYPGMMDMTYFAFTPPTLRARKLKIAVVYLHEEGRFELWLAGNNRQTQAETAKLLQKRGTGRYALSELRPGVDSIIAHPILPTADFDDPETLIQQIERETLDFTKDMKILLGPEQQGAASGDG
jgi:hypothetical protein